MTSYASLKMAKPDGVAEVVLKGPGKGNAMGPDFWRELPQVFAALDMDDEVRAVVLRGEGQHFSYGLDLPAMMGELAPGENMAKDRTKLLDMISTMQSAVTQVQSCRKPVIAAIAGWCIGGGLDLVAACDVRLCSAEARFSLREVRVAMVADIGSLQRLPPIIGEGNTRELALTGKDIGAERALQMGLVNEVFATPEALFEAAHAMARQIAENPPLVVQGIKRVMNATQGMTIEDGLRYVATWNAAFLQSHDLAEAINAFMQKRSPKYTGS